MLTTWLACISPLKGYMQQYVYQKTQDISLYYLIRIAHKSQYLPCENYPRN